MSNENDGKAEIIFMIIGYYISVIHSKQKKPPKGGL
jgi:hypothetical protein